ncbi:excalibur calcium-binding domain-containing protein [Streptomyces sp. HMX87]|uniref:excalibur calcium-binding domain-containing protein n=1 Tax=Streptomyces sp. HMX87 TaxID=3390849 RepID=UPI003A899F1C
MHLLRKPVAVAVTALALAALPATAAQAHDGNHPFENCTEAYDNGYRDIPAGDEHYGKHLDRDGDGTGCDKPPAGFVPADDKDDSGSGRDTGTGAGGESGTPGQSGTSGQKDTDLAATGGDGTTPYLAAGGAAVLLAGGGLLVAARRRRGTS